MLSHGDFEVTDEGSGLAECQLGVDEGLTSLQTKLVEPLDFDPAEVLIGEFLQGLATPQAERLFEQRRGGLRVLSRRGARPADRVLKDVDVHLVPADLENVAGLAPHENRNLAAIGPLGIERRSEARDVHPQGILFAVGIVAPQLFQNPVC